MQAVISHNEASFLRLILDSVSDCLVVVDAEGHIVLINKPYCDLLGGQPEDFIGRNVREAISPESQLGVVAQGGKPLVTEILNVRGQQIVTRQVPISMNGEIIGAIGVALFATSHLASTTLRALLGTALVVPADHHQWRARYSIDDIVGRGPEISRLKAAILQAARNNLPLLIRGETGVGKELVAQATHNISTRSSRPFVWVNCATIPPELVASELFGYDAGAFTGSNAKGAKGKLELAHDGTVFLDEIGDMPLHAQAALLRFLQEGEITRVGGTRPIYVNVRVISASHKNLRQLCENGAFREDLLYRLRVLDIEVPSLRQRNDLDLLASHALAKTQIELALPRLTLSSGAQEQLRRHSWPGNVRELFSVIRRAAARLSEDHFEIDDISMDLDSDAQSSLLPINQAEYTLAARLSEVERQAIIEALDATNGNKSSAALRLGIDRSSFYKRLRLYNL